MYPLISLRADGCSCSALINASKSDGSSIRCKMLAALMSGRLSVCFELSVDEVRFYLYESSVLRYASSQELAEPDILKLL